MKTKYPKKIIFQGDGNNDGKKYDGIISAHCTHTGVMNISMNPAGRKRKKQNYIYLFVLF